MNNLLTSTTAILASAALFAAGLMFNLEPTLSPTLPQRSPCASRRRSPRDPQFLPALGTVTTVALEIRKLPPAQRFLPAHGTAMTVALEIRKLPQAQRFLPAPGMTMTVNLVVLKSPQFQRLSLASGTE